jgi:hypothetical protein
VTLLVAAGPRVERHDFRFDNPSSFDEGGLVPHFFEQRYDATATWIQAAIAFPWLDADWRTEVGFQPGAIGRGADIDTFLPPSGDVVTSGTRGEVRWRSIGLRQEIGLARWREWRFGVAVGYRQSRADFLPADLVVTHTQPPSETRAFTTDRETTWVRVLESGARAARVVSRERWRLTIEGAALPFTRGRLRISLPDKYPGERFSFEAMSFGARGRVVLERHIRTASVGVELTLHGAWPYASTPRYASWSVGVGGLVRTSGF